MRGTACPQPLPPPQQQHDAAKTAGAAEDDGCPASAQPAARLGLGLPSPYLAELAAANECLKGLPLPGAPSQQQKQQGGRAALSMQGANWCRLPCPDHLPAFCLGALPAGGLSFHAVHPSCALLPLLVVYGESPPVPVVLPAPPARRGWDCSLLPRAVLVAARSHC